MIYQHYRNKGLYRVLWSAKDTTNGRHDAQCVVYMSLNDGEIYVREANEFHGSLVVERDVPDEHGHVTTWVKRFTQVSP